MNSIVISTDCVTCSPQSLYSSYNIWGKFHLPVIHLKAWQLAQHSSKNKIHSLSMFFFFLNLIRDSNSLLKYNIYKLKKRKEKMFKNCRKSLNTWSINIFLKLPVHECSRQIIRTVLKRFPPCMYGSGIKFTVESHSLFNRHSVRLPVIHKDKIILPTKTGTTCFSWQTWW